MTEGWRPIESAPRDGTRIWAVFANPLQGRVMERLSGLQCTIWHEGLTPSGYDLGWGFVGGGIGGIDDSQIAGWMPLPAPPPADQPTTFASAAS